MLALKTLIVGHRADKLVFGDNYSCSVLWGRLPWQDLH